MCATSAMETKVRTGHSSMGDSNTVVSAYAVLLSPIDTSLNKITMDDFKTALSLSLSLWEGGKQKEKSGMGVVYIGGDWLISLKQSSHFINSLTRLTLLKIAPSFIPPPPTR